ncbi:MAG: hypothetical protein LBN29_01505 [Mediterranea sp.]|nr:hypothetical protein [Mediterranea sp.]
MMKLTAMFALTLVAQATGLRAQDMYVENVTATPDAKEAKGKEFRWECWSAVPETFGEEITQQAGTHVFGQTVACLKVMLDQYYVSKEEIVPGDPMTRTVIKKPTLYNTIRKIEKYLKREVDRGALSASDAAAAYIHVLGVAITAVGEDELDSFEESLGKAKKDVATQLALFGQVKLKALY